MLTTRKVPRTCLSCQLHLLSIFEILFVTQRSTNASLWRYATTSNFRFRSPQERYASSFRSFSMIRTRAAEPSKILPEVAEIMEQEDDKKTEIEAVVRQARQTFGETLPTNYLLPEEYKLYERLYGPPTRETTADDLEFVPVPGEEGPPTNILPNVLREDSEGQFKETYCNPSLRFSFTHGEPEVITDLNTKPTIESKIVQAEVAAPLETTPIDEGSLELGQETIYIAKNKREMQAMARLQKDMEKAMEQSVVDEEKEEEAEYVEESEYVEEFGEEVDEDVKFGIYSTSGSLRTHPYTMAGRCGPIPTTIFLPQKALVAPITELLTRTKPIHLQQAAERAFGGKGLPHSTSTPKSGRMLAQKEIGLDASQHRMSEIEADAYITAVLPGAYASVLSILVEVRKRLGQNWIRDLMFGEGSTGPRVLDAGAGGAGILAWREVMEAEYEVMKDEGIVDGDFVPPGKSTAVTGSDCLRHRMSRFLDDTSFIPRLPDYIHASNPTRLDGGSIAKHKTFDIVIAPHTLLPHKEEYQRRNTIKNLWTLVEPKGGILIMLEKGLPRGFEAIAAARSLILNNYISSPGSRFIENELSSAQSNIERFSEKEEGMIVAPCTSHTTCPMYPFPGLSSGRKDFCHFPQRFIRPPFLQRVLGAKVRNHEDVKFSYIAFRRGVDLRKTRDNILAGDEATSQSFEGYEDHCLPVSHQEHDYVKTDVKFNTLSLPRVILSPLKRHGHVTLDLCTPSGKLERWTVPKSFSQVAYRDARKSKWGDLWALGAKTRVPRNVRLGQLSSIRPRKLKGIRDGRVGKGGKKMRQSAAYDMISGDEEYDMLKITEKKAADKKMKEKAKGEKSRIAPRAVESERY